MSGQITETEFVQETLKANKIVDSENAMLKSAIDLVRAAGYHVTKGDPKEEKSMLSNVAETTKEVGSGIGHVIRGLGRVTLERAQVAGNAVKDSVVTLAEKGK